MQNDTYIATPLPVFPSYMPADKCCVDDDDGSRPQFVVHKPWSYEFVFSVHDVLLDNFCEFVLKEFSIIITQEFGVVESPEFKNRF